LHLILRIYAAGPVMNSPRMGGKREWTGLAGRCPLPRRPLGWFLAWMQITRGQTLGGHAKRREKCPRDRSPRERFSGAWAHSAAHGGFSRTADVASWHNPDLRLAAFEGRFTGGLLTLVTKIGKLPVSEFSLARDQAANPSNEGVGFAGTGPPRAP